MKYYTSTTEYNCGIDLRAHQGASHLCRGFPAWRRGFDFPAARSNGPNAPSWDHWSGPLGNQSPAAKLENLDKGEMRPGGRAGRFRSCIRWWRCNTSFAYSVMGVRWTPVTVCSLRG